MPITNPTADDVNALHQFIQDRNEHEWQAALKDEASGGDVLERVRRLSNTTKIAMAGTAAFLLASIKRGDGEVAELTWHYLTTCGEQWQEHPDWKPAWENPSHAALLANLRKPR